MSAAKQDKSIEIPITFSNYFEIGIALVTFCSLNKSDTTSPILYGLSRYKFRPSESWSVAKVAKENLYFPLITLDNVQDIFERFCVFFENRG